MNFANSSGFGRPAMPVSERSFPSPRARLLLIEDDLEIAGELASDLTDRGYEVQHAATGTQGAVEARRGNFDLLIVDVMLPETDGLSVIEGLRRDGIGVPVLVISALGAVHDRVRGLQIGGDDYVTKPFALMEIAARVDALLRRPLETRATTLRVGPLELDLITRTARRGGRAIESSPRANSSCWTISCAARIALSPAPCCSRMSGITGFCPKPTSWTFISAICAARSTVLARGRCC